MRRLWYLAVAGVAAAVVAPSAGAFGGPDPNEKAIVNCVTAVERQIERGMTTGGGPKEPFLGPANCDHFFQAIGVIGNGIPGPLPPPPGP